MEVGLIGSYWGMRRFCYENGAFINAHDRAVSRDGKTKYRLLDREEDLEGREFSEAIMLDEHPDATDKEKERHKRIFRELYKTHRKVEFVIKYRIKKPKMDEKENYFEQQETEFITNFCDLTASTELYLPEDIGESAEQMAKRLFEDGWRISRSKGYLKII